MDARATRIAVELFDEWPRNRMVGVVHLVAAQNLEGMSAEDALLQPPGGGNCANWILGHLVNVHNDLARVLGVEPVWEDPRLARAGAEPITNPDEAIDWEALVAHSAAGEARLAGALAALTEEDLAAEIPTPAFGDTPRGIFLATVLFHRPVTPGSSPLRGASPATRGRSGFRGRNRAHPSLKELRPLRGMRMGGCEADGAVFAGGGRGGGS